MATSLMMTAEDALRQAVKKAGGQTALAVICGCTQGAIWQMLNRAEPRLSHRYVLIVERTLGISRYVLRPDIYPAPAEAE